MTAEALAPAQPGPRAARSRRYLMCPPTFFRVAYRINPWMDPTRPVDTDLAIRQWASLKRTYESLGHQVEVIEARDGLPDMVFAANGALVIDGRVLMARFRHIERRGEEQAYRRWFARHGYRDIHKAVAVNEGEGDFALVGDLILAGTGFRTDPAAHHEVAEAFDRRVVTLELTDPRFYHLDTALAVLDDDHIVYYPGAFSEHSRCMLGCLFPDAIWADEPDALALGLNAASDGLHVVISAQAERLMGRLAADGWEPVPVDVSELSKAGGGVKCCTLELRA